MVDPPKTFMVYSTWYRKQTWEANGGFIKIYKSTEVWGDDYDQGLMKIHRRNAERDLLKYIMDQGGPWGMTVWPVTEQFYPTFDMTAPMIDIKSLNEVVHDGVYLYGPNGEGFINGHRR